MAKGKSVRVKVILECTSCARNGVNPKLPGISRYITQKNRQNTSSQLELRKFCRYCYKHTIHGEIKSRGKKEWEMEGKNNSRGNQEQKIDGEMEIKKQSRNR